MPNWCFNHLRVTGPADRLTAFRDKANNATDFPRWRGEVDTDAKPDKDYHLNFNALYPVPPEVQAAGYAPDTGSSPLDFLVGPEPSTGYGWCLRHWGTKWNSGGAQLEEARDAHGTLTALGYEFDTAWSPPLDLFRHVAADFPALRFELEYEEPGNAFAGRQVCEGGVEVENASWEYREPEEGEEE